MWRAMEDPYGLFAQWFQEAAEAELSDPEAMSLATVNAEGRPSLRVVLLKDWSPTGGFVFYTNYQSRKGRDLSESPFVAATFYWKSLYRQVRIEGRAERLDRQASQVYFASRPRESQLSAWASAQSSILDNDTTFTQDVAFYRKDFEGRDIPCPPHWGGYAIHPRCFEFWLGNTHRRHDRLRFEKGAEESGWSKSFVYP